MRLATAEDRRWNWFFPLLFFAVFIFIKFFFVSHASGPIIFLDELEYKANAEQIFNQRPFFTAHYPPLYPLLLNFAFFSKENWYAWMLFSNVLVSSFVVLPVWLISIRLVDRSSAVIITSITALWHFNAAFPRVLMSENLYVPLFLVPILILLGPDKDHNGKDLTSPALFGIFMALAFLTKYIYAAAVPCLILLWWFRPSWEDIHGNREIFETRRFRRLMVILTAFAVTCIPWLIYAGYSNFSLAQALGFNYITKGIRAYATVKSLMSWVGLYLSYSVLEIAPFIFPFSVYAYLLISRRVTQNRGETFFLITVALLYCLFLATAVQHSWRSAYNYPNPNRVMGRYVIQFFPLCLIIFMIAMNKIRAVPGRLGSRTIIIPLLFSLGMILLAREVLFSFPMWHLKFDFVNSPDGVPYEFDKFTFFVLSAISLTAAIFACEFRNVSSSRRYAFFFSVIFVIFIQLVSSFGAYRWSAIRSRQVVHGRFLAEFLRDAMNEHDACKKIIYDIPDAPAVYAKTLQHSLTFWLSLHESGLPVSVIPLGVCSPGRVTSAKTYLVTGYNYGPPLFHYVVEGQNVGGVTMVNRWVLERFPRLGSIARDEHYFLYDFEAVKRELAASSAR